MKEFQLHAWLDHMPDNPTDAQTDVLALAARLIGSAKMVDAQAVTFGLAEFAILYQMASAPEPVRYIWGWPDYFLVFCFVLIDAVVRVLT